MTYPRDIQLEIARAHIRENVIMLRELITQAQRAKMPEIANTLIQELVEQFRYRRSLS